MNDTSMEKTFISLSPRRARERGILLKKPAVRNPSVKTTKSKHSYYRNKKSLINIYQKKNISFDHSKNNEYKILNYTSDNNSINQNQINDNLIKEKNVVINNLQNQIKKYVIKLKESMKQINIQKQIITSLKSQNKQLNDENHRKSNIIKQNEDINIKITKLKIDAEKSKEKKLKDNFDESRRNHHMLDNKMNNFKKELNEKDEEIKRYKTKNDYLTKLLNDNEEKLNLKNLQINKLNEDNFLIKNKLNELQNNFYALLQKTNNLNNINNFQYDNEMNNDFSNEKNKLLEIKIKNCYNEIKTKNMNINILNEKNQLLNSLMSQKNI